MFKSITSNLAEFRTFLFWLIAFVALGYVIEWNDPEGGPISSGWFQVLASCALQSAFKVLLMWVLLEAAFQTLKHWIKAGGFKETFYALSMPQRMAVFLTVLLIISYMVDSSFTRA